MSGEIKNKLSIGGGILFLMGAFATFILNEIFDWSFDVIVTSNIILSLADLIFFICFPVGIIFIIIGLIALYPKIERIDKVQAFLFFPEGTHNNDRTIEYHERHYHKKLIVNFKTLPASAYYMSAPNSYGWKLIKKYSDMVVSEVHDNSESEEFTSNWCKQHGYNLFTRSATKKDLLERD